MEIPYTSTARPDTGVYNGKLGVWLFLASEVMLFGGLFSSYIFLRIGAPVWPGLVGGEMFTRANEILSVPLATLNTMVLIASSVTMVMCWASLMLKDYKKYKRYMGLTLLCAFIFLVVKAFEYGGKFQAGLFPSDSNFLAVYFTLTGLHGLHVIGGIVVMLYLYGPGAKMWETDPQRFTNRIEIVGLYWHFVDLVWIFLFPTIYLL